MGLSLQVIYYRKLSLGPTNYTILQDCVKPNRTKSVTVVVTFFDSIL